MPVRNFHVVSADESVLEAARTAAAMVPDAVGTVREFRDRASLGARIDDLEGLILIDPALFAPFSAYEWTLEFLRHATALVFVVARGKVEDADGLARFVGAQGAIQAPIEPRALAERLASPFSATPSTRPAPLVPGDPSAFERSLSGMLDDDAAESTRQRFLETITDEETGLFSATFFEHRLEEEFKRSNRFRFPLGLVSFVFDGEAEEAVLLEVAGVILTDTRDVDIVARYDANTFVALLPHTGPAGTRMFGERVLAKLAERDLHDLLGERMDWTVAHAVGPDSAIATAPAFLARVVPDRSGQFA
ncbi:MAG TPA: diguanylate cyclase [Planctomycetota bacterium]